MNLEAKASPQRTWGVIKDNYAHLGETYKVNLGWTFQLLERAGKVITWRSAIASNIHQEGWFWDSWLLGISKGNDIRWIALTSVETGIVGLKLAGMKPSWEMREWVWEIPILTPGFSTEEEEIQRIMEKWYVLGCGTVKWILWKEKIIAARNNQIDNLIIKGFCLMQVEKLYWPIKALKYFSTD